jgi:hypothetical protein
MLFVKKVSEDNSGLRAVLVASHRTQDDLCRPLHATACGGLTGLAFLPSDLIERVHELRPSFVDLEELPSRFTRWERDEEAAAQAGHLRMIAKPTDGLLGCLATGRARNLDLGTIKRTFGDDAFLPEDVAKADSMTLSLVAV